MNNTKLIALLALGLFIINGLFSQTINSEIAFMVAEAKISALGHSADFQVNQNPKIIFNKEEDPLLYAYNLQPSGFIIVSANKSLPPVVAYSFENTIGATDENNILLKLVSGDLKTRYENIKPSTKEKYTNSWNQLLNYPRNNIKTFEQWPPEGTTSTGGWLETNWTQSYPYNMFCPMDPVTNQRSIAGCPSVAIAMIINYYESLNETQLEDVIDDYHHNYAGRNYWVDDDFETIDFLPFPDVNAYFDTISNIWESGSTLKSQEKAALVWACGVAAKQVYTSDISGTFGVDQAFDAFQRFGFEDSELLYPEDPILLSLAQNMMDARPALLAVVDPGVAGHNLVTDGFNTDGFYHLNFGWGGTYNSWYLIPDEIPYNLTEFEGVVANIAYPPINILVGENRSGISDINVYPNPVINELNVNLNLNDQSDISIELFDLMGNSCYQKMITGLQAGEHSISLMLEKDIGKNISAGFHFLRINSGAYSSTKIIIIK